MSSDKKLKIRKCMVQFCKTEASKGFSSLPSNEDQRKVWFDVCQIANTKLKKYYICHSHFKDEDFEHSREDGRLKRNVPVYPSLNLPSLVSFN